MGLYAKLFSYAYSALVLAMLPIALCLIVAGSGTYWLYRHRSDISDKVLFVCAFTALGAAIGLFMGASRQPAVTVILPALLTFITGFAAYLFSKESEKAFLEAVPAAIMFLILAAVFCGTIGAAMRRSSESFDREYAQWLARYQTVQLPFELELAKAKLRASPPTGP